MEQLDIAPVAQPSVSAYTVEQLNITRNPPSVDVTVADNTGKSTTITYAGLAAVTMINSGNFSVNSLQKQILIRLKNDGFLPAGSVSGSTD